MGIPLKDALRLGPVPRLALVGAGGKTTALFQLAREFGAPVLVTATTHLASSQLALADTHAVITAPQDLTPFESTLPEGITLLTGLLGADARAAGLEADLLAAVHRLADARHVPLLIEADGSRQRPLKAPAEHEPPIPAFVDAVAVVAGLSGIGRPLDEGSVHRPESFAALSGLHIGDEVTPAAVAKVLTHPLGGLKNIPAHARRVALLNQADTPDLGALGKTLSAELLGVYDAVAVAQLRDSGRVVAVHENVAGVILAAGSSSRVGQPKQLLEWRGQPFIRVVAQTALESGLSPVVVVLGADAEQVRPVISDLPLVVVHNPDWAQGQSTSAKVGLKVLPPKTGAAIFLLVDQPQVPAMLLRALVDLHADTLAPIVSPLVDGRRGNPVLFDRITFPDFESLEGDVGGRPLFAKYSPAWLPWLDNSLALDVDTLLDYQRLLNYED